MENICAALFYFHITVIYQTDPHKNKPVYTGIHDFKDFRSFFVYPLCRYM